MFGGAFTWLCACHTTQGYGQGHIEISPPFGERKGVSAGKNRPGRGREGTRW